MKLQLKETTNIWYVFFKGQLMFEIISIQIAALMIGEEVTYWYVSFFYPSKGKLNTSLSGLEVYLCHLKISSWIGTTFSTQMFFLTSPLV